MVLLGAQSTPGHGMGPSVALGFRERKSLSDTGYQPWDGVFFLIYLYIYILNIYFEDIFQVVIMVGYSIKLIVLQ